jgi:hypothetical protein
MSNKSQSYHFFSDRYSPAYRVASWWMTLKSICFFAAAVVLILGMTASLKFGPGGFLMGVAGAAACVIVGLVFEVFAALLRVLIDSAVSTAPTLTDEERLSLIKASTASSTASSTSANRSSGGTGLMMRYSEDMGVKQTLDVSEIAERVRAHPDREHLVWMTGMKGWANPSTLTAFEGLLDPITEEPVDDEPTG